MKQIRKKYLIWLFLCYSILSLMFPLKSFAAYDFNRSGAYVSIGGTIYRPNCLKAYAYIPFDVSKEGNNINKLVKMLSLPSAQTGYGTLAKGAAFRYHGFDAIAGSNSQYLVKYAAAENTANVGTKWVKPSFSMYGSTDMFEFRYAGMVINSLSEGDLNSGKVIAGTNPYFPSDSVQAGSSSGKPATQATIFKKAAFGSGVTSSQETAYGTPAGVHRLADVYTNGMYGTTYKPSIGNVLTNIYSNFNSKETIAKEAFRRWVEEDNSGFGAAYKVEAETWLAQNPGSNLEWWQVLNQFFQINGDATVKNNTIYFYCVTGALSGGTYYNTYVIGSGYEKNTTPTHFAIKDNQTGEILSESYRIADQMDSNKGAGDETLGQTATLEYRKYYTLEGILTYYSSESGESATNRGVDLLVVDTGINSDASYLSASMQATAVLPDADALNHETPVDKKSYGKINASGNKTTEDNGKSFYYNGAAFSNIMFSVTEEMPAVGYLILAVPDAFGESGDNEVTTDDRIAIRYIISEDPCPNPEDCIIEPSDPAFGDLNLGMPEYRDLHYIAQHEEEPEEEEGEEGDDSGDGGEEEEKEPVITILEKSSGYGYYKDVSSTPIESAHENDTPEVPNNIDIWDAGSAGDVSDSEDEVLSDPWWEYTDRVWPNQLEDLENKCWLTDANGGWNQSGLFLRSKNGENSFGFGFRVSRSRGTQGTILGGATLETEIYGVSPDTGEDGILLTEYTDGGNRYKTLRTGSIGVYEYADVKYQGIVSSAAINGIEDFPFIRVVTRISQDVHGESGLFTSVFKAPAENSWEEEHDSVDRTFACEMDDMRILEVEVKDSEGIVIYNANRYDSSNMDVEVDGYFDREEDLFLKVVIEQSLDSGHQVNEPAIDVSVRGLNEDGSEVSTYINDVTYTKYGEKMYLEVPVSYDDIAFRPRNCQKLRFSIAINEKHGEDMWRENIWDNDEDAYTFTIDGTTADLAISQDIELYNSKNNPQEFLTFAEYLSFKFNIKHIGGSERQTAVVGGTDYNPFPKVNVSIYNADALSLDPINGNIIYRMASQDPKAASALIMEGDIQAETRLFPGLGTNDYASHVQAW